MIICAFENSPSIPSFLVTKIVYIGYGQLKKWLLFLFPFHICAPSSRAHQTRRSRRNSRPMSAKVALPRLQSEIKVALFLFASHSFLANNLRFMVKLIVKNWSSGHPPFLQFPLFCTWLSPNRIFRYARYFIFIQQQHSQVTGPYVAPFCFVLFCFFFY
jgi:hypothetical protein